MSEHKGKKQKNPQAAAREANTQQLTELKYLKSQLAQKNQRIAELEQKVADLTVIANNAAGQISEEPDDELDDEADAEGQRPGKFAPAGTPVADVTQA